jgi:hypothetical protein
MTAVAYRAMVMVVIKLDSAQDAQEMCDTSTCVPGFNTSSTEWEAIYPWHSGKVRSTELASVRK